MANFSKLYITNGGKELLNRNWNSGKKLLFTEVVLSDQVYEVDALEELTGLEGICQRVDIRKVEKLGNSVQISSVILNTELEEGYFVNTLGVYARLEDSESPVLFAVAAEQMNGTYMPPQSQTVSGIDVKLRITLDNGCNITIQSDPSAVATIREVMELENNMNSHIGDLGNPHGTTREQLGLGNVDNTADRDKPVSTAQREAIDSAYSRGTGYTDQKIADLINGAPSTLDTLGEIAQAMRDNEDVVSALEEAIGNKADAQELQEHGSNGTIHVTAAERQTWNSLIGLINALTANGAVTALKIVNALPADAANHPKTFYLVRG
ncbi:MAG: hypothetical protein HFH80_08350 [Lachnospiraceae bacterium]|nr:hypothetical protein [Lachnospiraceae bacterium]